MEMELWSTLTNGFALLLTPWRLVWPICKSDDSSACLFSVSTERRLLIQGLENNGI